MYKMREQYVAPSTSSCPAIAQMYTLFVVYTNIGGENGKNRLVCYGKLVNICIV